MYLRACSGGAGWSWPLGQRPPAETVVTEPAPRLLCHLLPTGKYIENHGVVHNMYYNTTSKVKLPYHATLGIERWWDNGSVPIWITAQRQVTLHHTPLDGAVG